MTTTISPPAPVAPLRAVPAPPDRPPYLLAAIVSLAALVLYVLTLAPTTQFWDASEYITAAHALGIPHPPANPFFVILGHVWGLLPLGAEYARRINLLAAVSSAASAGLWFLIGERWLRTIVAPLNWRRVGAAAGAIVGATMFTVWNQSVVNEKVYTFSVLSIALVLWLTLRWADQPDEARRDKLFLVIVYLIALSATNHLMGILVIPAVLVYVLRTDARTLLKPGLLAAALLVAIVGLSVNLFIPIRATLDPYLNQGDAWTWANLRDVLMREQFGKPSVFENPMYPAGPGAENPGRSLELIVQQYLNYWQYFTWQFGRDSSATWQSLLALVFLALGAAGAWRHVQADRRSGLAMLALVLTLTVALVFYLNFKWGYSQPYTGLDHEVRERDYFFVASFVAWGVWVGMGLAAIAAALAARLPPRAGPLAALVFVMALIPLAGNRLSAPRNGETVARDYARDVLRSVDPYALIITTGDNDTFPLWHAQEVEGLRRDVSVMVMSLANTNWYLDQLQRRPPAPYVAAPGEPGAPVPAAPWMSAYYRRSPADTLPPYILLDQVVTGTIGPIQVTLDPRAIGRPYLGRSDLAVLQIIKDQLGRRPIYFSSSTGNIPDALGLSPYLLNEGLVRRLMPAEVKESETIKPIAGRGFVNVPRVRTLAFDVYRGGEASARPRPRGWVDRPSQNSLLGYALVYDTIATALREREPALATRAIRLRDAILANTTYSVPNSDD